MEETAGLSILGAPRGEGQASVVAAKVKGLLDDGVAPEEIILLTRSWDDEARLIHQMLLSWGIPVVSERAEPLVHEAAICALRTAAGLAAGGWERDRVVRVLRNGQLRPSWPEIRSDLDLPESASAIQACDVFRGRDAIRAGLARLAKPREDRDDTRSKMLRPRAERAVPIFDRLVSIVPPRDLAGRWDEQADRLRNLATELGIETSASRADRAAIEQLWLSLDDHGAILARLDRGEAAWTWSRFLDEVDRLVREVAGPAAPERPGSVRFATVDEAAGVVAEQVIVVNLTEGTFPTPASERQGEEASSAHLSRERLLFLRTLGSATRGLTLAYPSVDEQGIELLPAAFLEDMEAAFSPEAWRACREVHSRLDPIPTASRAGRPGDARVRAVSLALSGSAEGREALRALARSPEHRPALRGVAAALDVSQRRSRSRFFGPYDGRLIDDALIRRIAEDFGPSRPAFSPSQLESLALCPYQFYMRYVLHLAPVEERGELDDDRAARGSLIHRALEQLHVRLKDTADDEESLVRRVAVGIEADIRAQLESERPPSSDVDAGLREISARRLQKTGRLYASQFADYLDGPGQMSRCDRFEVRFGDGQDIPALAIGAGADLVTMQGTIDRIDLIGGEDAGFRVIDYKSGSAPAAADLGRGLALQLPLYALAVERLGIVGQAGDFGYWSLSKSGYRPVKLPKDKADDPWAAFRNRLEAFVIELVSALRRAKFPVSPRSEDCASHCDYSAACRIKHVRSIGKVWADAPRLEPPG